MARLTTDERNARREESLSRAIGTIQSQNDSVVEMHYAALGIHATPRVDVFTYNAWQALGRQVRKGEHGCRLTVWIHPSPSATNKEPKPFPKSTTVFHVSQTDAIDQTQDRLHEAQTRRTAIVQFAQSLGA